MSDKWRHSRAAQTEPLVPDVHPRILREYELKSLDSYIRQLQDKCRRVFDFLFDRRTEEHLLNSSTLSGLYFGSTWSVGERCAVATR